MKYIEESMGWWYSHFALSHCDIFCYIKLWNGQYYCQDSFMETNCLRQKQKSLNAFLWCEFFLIVVLSRLYFTFCALRKLWKRAKISMSFRTSEQDWPPLLFCLFKKPCRSPTPLRIQTRPALALSHGDCSQWIGFSRAPPQGVHWSLDTEPRIYLWGLSAVNSSRTPLPIWKHC